MAERRHQARLVEILWLQEAEQEYERVTVAVTLRPELAEIGTGWKQISETRWAVKLFDMNFTDVAASLPRAEVDSKIEELQKPTEMIALAHQGYQARRDVPAEALVPVDEHEVEFEGKMLTMKANGAVERAVQALRYQCNIFLAQMEEGVSQQSKSGMQGWQRHSEACPGITLVTLEVIWDLEGRGDRATGEEDEAASDPETVIPDERTATHERKGESEDQSEPAANPRVVPPESARVRDPAEEERDAKAAKDEVLELPYDEQQAETMIEHDHQLTGDVEAEQGFKSSEGFNGLLHVDEMLGIGTEDFIMERLVPAVESRYKVTYELITKPGQVLWMQQRVAQGFFQVGTVPTATNVADLNTKTLSRDRVKILSFLVGVVSGEFEGETEEWVPVGFGEYEALMMKENTRLAIRRIRSDLSGHEVFEGASSTSITQTAKRVFAAGMISVLLQPGGSEKIEHDALSRDNEPNGLNNQHDWIMDAIFFCSIAWMAVCISYGCFYLMKCGYGKISAWFGTAKVKEENIVFITEFGKHYHRRNCKWLVKSILIEIEENTAVARHYKKCHTCHYLDRNAVVATLTETADFGFSGFDDAGSCDAACHRFSSLVQILPQKCRRRLA
ncbi:unnamed protein product [Effrenium voratum]|uniref:Uncharacterized protein n=1 Tax=Effrenium voratum TaxID=2562239 RepID=A0AA36IDC9_9DINO|nr:unnamed protein product [Effrenium voratum]